MSPGKAHRGGEQPMVGEATFRSYYGMPIINRPVWKSPDIPGYLFLGGLAGASSVMALAAGMTGRPRLSRRLKVTSTAAIGLGGAALTHDLGRPARFFNMLRVFKPSSPMNMGSWLLFIFSPFSAAAALHAVTGRQKLGGAVGSVGAALTGPLVATYTGALFSNTAVPAWHEGFQEMPFVFAASAVSSAAGAGLVIGPLDEVGPLRLLGTVAAGAEVALIALMKRNMGEVQEAFTESKKGYRYERAARLATGAGITVGAVLGRRSRIMSALGGAGLLVGSALIRFAIFETGLTSADNPRYTVVPQRRRRDEQADSVVIGSGR